ncbi:hypothetical protein Glove_99g129 [Diversispora epigaea]|uniref:Reelin domain-containing protein n=1 Tax=Diversispora epigaea TaxID=1348612 RepID=A0A397J4B0_9GLOM|nr:hypothetical protein Glove_99g129 [Diversispora epigaea]
MIKINIILTVTILLSVISGTLSHSTGSTVCSVDQKTLENVPSKPMGTLNSSLGFDISKDLKYEAGGDSLDIKIEGTEDFNGFLIWALDSDNKNQGTFELPSSNYKFITTCDNVVTHSNPGQKGTSVTVKWSPPKEDAGDITIKVAIVVTFEGFQLLDTTIKSSSSSSPSSSTGSSKPTKSKSTINTNKSITGNISSSIAPTLTSNNSNSSPTTTTSSTQSTSANDNSQLSASPLLLLLILTILIFINF